MASKDPLSHAVAARDFIVSRLKAEFIGPDPGLPAVQTGIHDAALKGQEILRQEDPPRVRYGAGVLFPRQVEIEDQNRADTGAETDAEAGPGANEDGSSIDGSQVRYGSAADSDTEQEINRANEYLPSAMGLTALVRVPEQLRVTVSAARYEPEVLSGQPAWKGKYEGWRRVPIHADVPLTRAELERGGIIEREISTGSSELRLSLHVYVRDAGVRSGSRDGRMITFTLLNRSPAGGRGNQECLFQCALVVQDPARSSCFLEYPDRAALEPEDIDSELMRLTVEEQDSMRLLYRSRRVFAVGHGCAPEWTATGSDSTDRVWTETIPVHEIPPVLPT